MDWIMIAVVGGSILVSGHSSEEACRGRAAMVEKDQKVAAKCVEAPHHGIWVTGSSVTLGSPGTCCLNVGGGCGPCQ
jgi:hypothetical protein